MEKEKIKLNYKNSGVNTLKSFGSWFIGIGAIALIVFFLSINSEDASLIVASICVSLSSFFAGGICLGLSGIARSVLYQREVLRQKYDFEFM